jgi:hypothetical protein
MVENELNGMLNVGDSCSYFRKRKERIPRPLPSHSTRAPAAFKFTTKGNA